MESNILNIWWIFSIEHGNLTNLSAKFYVFWPKFKKTLQILKKILRFFDKISREHWFFQYFSKYFWDSCLLLKLCTLKENTSFLQQYFLLRGRSDSPPKANAFVLTWNVRLHLVWLIPHALGKTTKGVREIWRDNQSRVLQRQLK